MFRGRLEVFGLSSRSLKSEDLVGLLVVSGGTARRRHTSKVPS